MLEWIKSVRIHWSSKKDLAPERHIFVTLLCRTAQLLGKNNNRIIKPIIRTKFLCQKRFYGSGAISHVLQNIYFSQRLAKNLFLSIPQFKAVCPPIDNRIPSGLSRLMTSSTNSWVIGTKYTTSACGRKKLQNWSVNLIFGKNTTLL